MDNNNKEVVIHDSVVSTNIDELINTSTIIIPDELKADVAMFSSLRDGYGYEEFDEEREELISKLLLANSKETSSSEFWNGFDLVNANQYQLADYIREHSNFDKEKCDEVENREHFLIYMVQNKINGKIYVGQHRTFDVNDDYMGSGKVIRLAENKYGLENFEKVILFDFETFDEMNQKESDIVTDIFWRKRDCVYNRHSGGIYGPSSEFQKEMYRLGLWKSYAEGSAVYHNEDGVMRRFKDGDEIPEGWVKGIFKDEEYIELHRKIDERMGILRSLGSNYTWRQGDTVEVLDNFIEQFKKAKKKEDEERTIWREIFEFYKENGSTRTMEKYNGVSGIVHLYDKFEKYFKDEYSEFKKTQKEQEVNDIVEFERIKEILVSSGFERKWDSMSFRKIMEIYEKYLKRKEELDIKIEKYTPIMEECYNHGLLFVVKKYNDRNIAAKLQLYTPHRYKEYMKDKRGKDIDINLNPYENLTCNGISTSKRKRRTPGEEELKRKQMNHEERVKLFNELHELGSKMEYDENAALVSLRNSIKLARARIEKKNAMIQEYREMYDYWVKFGFKEMAKKFSYTGTKGNLKKRFSIHLIEYNKDLISGTW